MKLIVSFLSIFLLLSCNRTVENVTLPEAFVFGASIEKIEELLLPLSDSLHIREIEPIELPTAKTSQRQMDISGFEYAGKKREVELVFADDVLDMVWVLTNADEERDFIEQFTNLYGNPTHIKEDVTFFLDNGVAVRNQPHEILFISDRLKDPYRAWLEGSMENK